MILSKTEQKAILTAQGVANEVRPIVEYLEDVASVYPPIQSVVQESRSMLDMLTAVSSRALEADRVLSAVQ